MMFSLFRVGGASLVLAGVCAGGAAWAQVPPQGAATDKAGAVAVPAMPPSVFESYRAYDEPKAIPWREANDTVGSVGGWRAYAREAQSGTPAPAAPDAAQASPAGHTQHHTNGGRP